MSHQQTKREENGDLSPDKMRYRIEVEDNLLNSRSTFFLTINGLWVAAVGVGSELYLRAGVGVLGVIVCLLWLISSWQSQRVIASLTKEYRWLYPENRLERIVQRQLERFGWFRPTNILAFILPSLFVVTWVILLFWLSRSLSKGV